MIGHASHRVRRFGLEVADRVASTELFEVVMRRPRSIGTRVVDWLHGTNTEHEMPPVRSSSSLEAVGSPLPRDCRELGSRPTLQRKNQTVFDVDPSILAMCDQQKPPDICNPRVWWRHPVARLINVWLVIILDFYIYGEDPVQDSYVIYPYFGVFEDFFLKWPENPAYGLSRVLIFIFTTLFSIWFGQRVIHHWFLRDTLGLMMFSEDKGVLLVNAFTWVAFFEYVMPYPVNLIETGTTDAPITEDSTLRYNDWGKIWQSTAAAFDLVSIVMITDTVLQDRTVWPDWGGGIKWLWNDACAGWVRIVVAWAAFLGLLPLLIYGLYKTGGTNGVYESRVVTAQVFGDLRHNMTTQWQRVLIASLLTCIDIMTCLQDWEFPSFNTPTDFMIAGTWTSHIEIGCVSRCLRPISQVITLIPVSFWEVFHFHMSGKWLAYLPAIGALGVDWWYLCRTIYGFNPQKVGEYEDPENCTLYVITDTKFLDQVYDHGVLKPEMKERVGYKFRHDELASGKDMMIHSRYCEYFFSYAHALSITFCAMGLLAGLCFIVLVIRAEYYWDRFLQRHADHRLQAGLEDRVVAHLQNIAQSNDDGFDGSADSASESDTSEAPPRR